MFCSEFLIRHTSVLSPKFDAESLPSSPPPNLAASLVILSAAKDLLFNDFRIPFHGYYFRILDRQGANAFGGAKNYVVDGKMTGGFAFVAFPALYRSSGVKTFIVNRYGSVYEKDLGPSTAKMAASLNVFNPDATWAAAR